MGYETTKTAEEILLAGERFLELQYELATAKDTFEAYWAESASSQGLRDYRAGRVL